MLVFYSCQDIHLACTDAAGAAGSVSVRRAITAHPVPMEEIHWSWS